MSNTNNRTYTIGIKIEGKEHYDELMEKYSEDRLFGLNFKRLFEGYPDGYPCLVQYTVGSNPMGFMYGTQIGKIIDGGYLVQLSMD